MKTSELRRRLLELERQLGQMVRRDPDIEVSASVARVIEVLIVEAKEALPDDPVGQAVDDFFSPTIEFGDTLFASQVQIVIGMLASALPVPKRTNLA